MANRKSEDVEITAFCQNDNCEATGVAATIGGRFNSEGEFEAFDDEDLKCLYCEEPLVTEE